jgi:hypothetical protein
MKFSFKLRPAGTLGWRSASRLTLGSCFLVISAVAVGTSALAKLRIGEIVEEIKQSGRISQESEPGNLFSTALLIQAGLRALLPPAERVGVALPGAPNPNDPQDLSKAQQNYTAVFDGGKEATKAQRDVALNAVAGGARQLQKQGYQKAAMVLTTWLQNQGFQRKSF